MVLVLLCVCMCAEARGLVRALIQPDPTVRLTAEQTLQHPWVKAMASICRQRALTDKTQRNTADNGAEPDRVQRLAQINAAETMTDKTPGNTSSEGEITHKELSTPLEATPGQQREECTSTGSPSREASRREIQDPGSNTDREPGSLTSPSVEHKQLSDPSAQTDPPAQIETQSKRNSQQQSPPYSPPSTNPVQQTQTNKQTNPATASSSHSLHQQNFSSPPANPTTATAKNYDEQNVHTTSTHPPTQF